VAHIATNNNILPANGNHNKKPLKMGQIMRVPGAEMIPNPAGIVPRPGHHLEDVTCDRSRLTHHACTLQPKQEVNNWQTPQYAPSPSFKINY